ncbi:TonB system transporter [Silvimonas amylolytica]|uniref:TonB system transporter n=1 Tax=Silvimonas amylolytica TaxID=449663 RepID=A0ABQ2PLI6_9NEIS|nr:TonB system transporter [Silvimonas amylolytica]
MALALIGATYAASAFADDADNSSQIERVEVTGSNIKRIGQQGGTSVTVIKADDLVKQGIVTVEQAVATIAANTSSITSSSAVGTDNAGASFADLRGLGYQRTLVLLDGRRLASQASFGTAVDLNAIPMATIERIDVLPAGVSAVYGSDAEAGVINFITKKSIQGATLEVKYLDPQHPGGITKEVSVTGGKGSLADDGFNIYGSFSAQKSSEIKTTDRSFATDRLNPNGVSAYTGPANYADAGIGFYNPLGTTCNPPVLVYDSGSGICREQTPLYYGIQPETEQYSATVKASKQAGDNLFALQYVGTQTTTKTKVAPSPLIPGSASNTFTISPGNPNYPTNIPATEVDPDTGDVYNNVNQQPVTLYGRSTQLGPRIDEYVSTTQRVLATAEGQLGSWDYKSGLGYSQNSVRHYLTGGYVGESLLQPALDAGTVNPFSDSTAGWDSVQVNGKEEQDKYSVTMADFHASKEVYQLPAGAVAVSFGAEARHESLQSHFTDLATQAMSTGLQYAVDTSGSRNVYALSAEAQFPIIKNLDVDIALRDDYYADVGNSFSPMVSLKYQPIKEVAFRASGSTGFRAPSLYDKYQPASTSFTANPYNDPLLCPGGTVNSAAGGVKGRDCGQQMQLQTSGNTNLQPEKSTSASFGVILEPIKSLTATVDFWWTDISHTISPMNEEAIFGNPEKYADRFVRDSNGVLLYVLDPTQNLGDTNTSGIDLSAAWSLPKTAIGNFTVTYNGTYLTKFDYQFEEGGQYFHGVGNFAQYNNAPIFRYKQNLNLNWVKGNWSGILGSTYQTGYKDQNNQDEFPGSDNHVASYILWNLSGTYVYQKDLTITAGIKNLFDKAPPYSNQVYAFQQGYDPRVTDSVGRAYYLQASYKM